MTKGPGSSDRCSSEQPRGTRSASVEGRVRKANAGISQSGMFREWKILTVLSRQHLVPTDGKSAIRSSVDENFFANFPT